MTDEPLLYAPFAETAKREGIEAATARFREVPGLDELVKLWHARRSKIQFGGPIIARAGGEPWYSGPTELGVHWKSLRAYFAEHGWPEDRIESVNDSSNSVVAHTPDPRDRSAAGRGLVVGFVQSGKTTNFVAVTAKLADEGYNFVIVLSGIHNGLRRQTQERLLEQLQQLNPARWHKLTDEHQDFGKQTLTPSSVLASAADQVALAVVKKNATVLRKLVAWLDTEDGRRALRNSRVLVVDDEADQASVATGSINPLILKLLSLMPRHTYIGYTATPFANVFINPADEDLYPRDFILSLPKPDEYFGPEKIFGRYEVDGEDAGDAPDGYDMIRHIPDEDVGHLRPLTRRDAESFEPALTEDVVDAIRWFWLATAARRARGDRGHSTMLVHTSVQTDVHKKLEPLFAAFFERSHRLIDRRERGVIGDLRRLWEQETARVPAARSGGQNTFEEVLVHLDDVLAETQVVLENSRSDDRLDYSSGPVVAIAIGGNTLSRGLTLEGLVVSVFVRSASAYDTLLQMGRWFGYRTGYEDLPRIWMTQELELAFRHLAQVEHEMRADILRYQTQDRTPMDLAVRIRTHPSLQITAKMGSHVVPAEVSYAGSRLQTRYFHRNDGEWLGRNLDAADRLVRAASMHSVREASSGHHVFRAVPVTAIREFLTTYQVHEDSPDMDPTMLLRYIDRQVSDTGRLQEWNVVVVNGSKDERAVGSVPVKRSVRARLDDGSSERADIKTLMSRKDIILDLETPPGGRTEDALKKARDEDPLLRDRGLLVLYVIEAMSEPAHGRTGAGGVTRHDRVALDAVDDVVGLGLYFPGDPTSDRKVRATHVAVRLPEGAPEPELVDQAEWLEETEDAS